jgi:hypothetical protein
MSLHYKKQSQNASRELGSNCPAEGEKSAHRKMPGIFDDILFEVSRQ